jgi:hypothetical protein
MCIIMFKPVGAGLPKREHLLNAINNNPDGVGFCFPLGAGVLIRKGLPDYPELMRAINGETQKAHVAVKDTPMIIHARIGTSGKKAPESTHPFPGSSCVDDLKALRIVSSVAISHNGIIGKGEGDLSDTMVFVRDVLSALPYESFRNIGVQRLVEKYLGGDKLIIMNKSGDCVLWGRWETEGTRKWSNDTYTRDQSHIWYNSFHYGMGGCKPGEHEAWGKCDSCHENRLLKRVGKRDMCFTCRTQKTMDLPVASTRAGRSWSRCTVCGAYYADDTMMETSWGKVCDNCRRG